MGNKIYIVEDNPLILENLQGTLEDLPGVQVVGHSANESDAVAWLSEPSHAWDLAVVDLFLKTGTGLGVLEKMARSAPAKHLVVLSNYAGREIRQQCLRLGAKAVFDKSQEIDDFVAFVRQRASAAGSGSGGGSAVAA